MRKLLVSVALCATSGCAVIPMGPSVVYRAPVIYTPPAVIYSAPVYRAPTPYFHYHYYGGWRR